MSPPPCSGSPSRGGWSARSRSAPPPAPRPRPAANQWTESSTGSRRTDMSEAAIDITRDAIPDTVRRIVADALGRPEAEVKLDSILMEDLGAESLDFLDIVFRLE